MAEKPVFYYVPLSPPCRSALLTAAALGIDFELKEVNLLEGEQYDPDFLKMNPQHTVPFLDDNGVYVSDSHAICTYLSDKYGADDSLYPKDLVSRAHVDSRLHFDSGHLFPRLRALFQPVFYQKSHELPTKKIEEIRSQWKIMEGFLEYTLYLCGDKMTLADLCCIATVSSLTEIVPIDADKYPKFTEWIARMGELPYYEEKNGVNARAIQAALIQVRQQNENALQ